jgi:hypothetical protein
MELSKSKPSVERLTITNNDLQMMCMDADIHNLRHYQGISQEELQKTAQKIK